MKGQGYAEVMLPGGPVQFETGQPVEFPFAHGISPAPRPPPGDPYQQKLEPTGYYVVPMWQEAEHYPEGYELGMMHFENPLVLEFNDPPHRGHVAYDATSWKARLAKQFRAQGKRLSEKLRAVGYDGVVTVVTPNDVREIVSLRQGFRPNRRVQVDREEVREITGQILKELYDMLDRRVQGTDVVLQEDTELGDVVERYETLASVTLDSGLQIEVEVRRSNAWRMVPSAHFSIPWDPPGQIMVFLNSRLPLAWYLPGAMEPELRQQLYSILIHEVTHATDPRGQRAVQGQVRYHSHAEDPEGYYSDPVEVKAYAAMVIEDVLEYFEKYATRRAMAVAAERAGKPLATLLLENALRSSTAYQEYVVRMNPDAQQKVLKDLHRELSDAGLV